MDTTELHSMVNGLITSHTRVQIVWQSPTTGSPRIATTGHIGRFDLTASLAHGPLTIDDHCLLQDHRSARYATVRRRFSDHARLRKLMTH